MTAALAFPIVADLCENCKEQCLEWEGESGKLLFVGALGARPPAAKTFLERKVLDSKEL